MYLGCKYIIVYRPACAGKPIDYIFWVSRHGICFNSIHRGAFGGQYVSKQLRKE